MYQAGDAVELRLHARLPVRGRASPAERAEEVDPISRVLEQAVQVDAGDVALAKPETAGQVCFDVGVGHRVPEMDLVTFHPPAIRREHPRPASGLVACENGLDVE